MTTTHPASPEEDSAPWPIPDGTLIPEELSILLARLHDIGEALEGTVMALDAKRPVKRDEFHPVWLHDMALVLDALDRHAAKVKEVFEFAAERFCREIPYGTSAVTFGDVRPMKPRFASERKGWRNDLLQEDVIPLLLADPDSGEKRSPEDVLAVTLSVVSLNGSNAKTTGIKGLGLDPDDYCFRTPTAPTVQFVVKP